MESIKSVGIGLVLFVAAFPTLFMNEGCAVKAQKSLDAAGKAAVIVKSNASVDAKNEGKLVHMTGEAQATAKLSDSTFGVEVSGIKMDRSVEMYQWIETKKTKTKKKTGGKKRKVTTYTYKKGWAKGLQRFSNKNLDAKSRRKYANPGSMPYEGKDYLASSVKFGGFELPKFLVQKIQGSEKLPMKAVPEALKSRAKLNDGGLYIGTDAANPMVGDVRVSFTYVKSPVKVSILAQQTKNTFTKFQPDPDLNPIGMLSAGVKTKDQMVASAKDAAATMTWITRLIGFIMMFAGMMMVFKPLVVVADVLPFLGSMLEMGLGIFCGLIAFALSFVTIAIAWIFYRPLLGILLLLLGVGAFAGLFVMSKKKKEAAAA